MITARDVGFAYDKREVLEGIDLRAAEGQVVGLIGPNGSGKTTLLRTLYAALRPRTGAVWIDDTPMADLKPRQIARQMAVVVQEGAGDMPLSVVEMVMLGRVPHLSSFQRPRDDDYHIAADALRRVGSRDLADRPFAELSGGERQRVLVARALAQQAQYMLLDEPTNHLDIRFQHEILQLVKSLEVTTVVVLHDLNLAGRYCDQLLLLDQGRIVARGTPDQVLQSEVLTPVYGIGVQRLLAGGHVQLLFHPLDQATAPAATTALP